MHTVKKLPFSEATVGASVVGALVGAFVGEGVGSLVVGPVVGAETDIILDGMYSFVRHFGRGPMIDDFGPIFGRSFSKQKLQLRVQRVKHILHWDTTHPKMLHNKELSCSFKSRSVTTSSS